MAKSMHTLRTALVLIDIQEAFNDTAFWGSPRSTSTFEQNVTTLLSAFRHHRQQNASSSDPALPLILHIHHHSLHPETPLSPGAAGLKPMSFANPIASEVVLTKSVNSAFINTRLEALLRQHAIQQLVICGLTTDHCVSTTTRMAANLGWRNEPGAGGHVEDGNVVLVADACATFARGRFVAETVHDVALASLDGEFADVLGTEEVVRGLFG